MRRYMTAVAVLLALAGCVRTLHPLYTEEDLAFDPALVGVWQPTEGNEEERWDFRKAGDKVYTLVHTDEEDRTARLTAHLVELEGHRFLDLRPQQREDMNSVYQLHLQPVHTFLRVESIEPLRLSPMKPNWIKNYLQEHPQALAHEDPEDGPAVLTASTEDLQDFVLEHVDTEQAWGGLLEFRRVEGGDSSSGADGN